MATLIICLPDDKHERLKELATSRNMSVNRLVEELTTMGLAEFDAETRFQAMVAKGGLEAGSALLDRLDTKLT